MSRLSSVIGGFSGYQSPTQPTNIAVIVTGQVEFTTAGTYTWTVPDGVFSISVVAVGGGAAGSASDGGRGGSLAYINNYSVVPGTQFGVFVGRGGTISSTGGVQSGVTGPNMITIIKAAGGAPVIQPSIGTVVNIGGAGGNGYTGNLASGGGAGGYSGAGGAGSGYTYNASTQVYTGVTGKSGAGGGGGGGGSIGGGGGVGIYGQGANGSGNSGGGGSGGTSGGARINTTGGIGGLYGGGGGGASTTNAVGTGGKGAVRIIWPGNTRIFPSTRTANE